MPAYSRAATAAAVAHAASGKAHYYQLKRFTDIVPEDAGHEEMKAFSLLASTDWNLIAGFSKRNALRDPSTGRTAELSKLYDHALGDGTDRYIVTDDPQLQPERARQRRLERAAACAAAAAGGFQLRYRRSRQLSDFESSGHFRRQAGK